MAVIFVHGYNVSFEEAALRAAQIGFDLQVPGITAFFSWPSRGTFVGYHADEAAVEASATHLADFLEQFVRESGATRVHVLSHGMGVRGLLRAFRSIRQQAIGRSVPFGQLILAAPDVDSDVFRHDVVPGTRLAERTTMYVSSRDSALASSAILAGYHRAGYTPPVTIVSGVDTVDASGVDLSYLGHGYYGEARAVLTDMHALLVSGVAAHRRYGLLSKTTEKEERYWTFHS
jgi:esterase/lipase superfamily enzyme